MFYDTIVFSIFFSTLSKIGISFTRIIVDSIEFPIKELLEWNDRIEAVKTLI